MFSASSSRCVKVFIYVSLFLLILLIFLSLSSLRLSLDIRDNFIDLFSLFQKTHPDASVLVLDIRSPIVPSFLINSPTSISHAMHDIYSALPLYISCAGRDK